MIEPKINEGTKIEYDELATLRFLAHCTRLTGEARISCSTLADEFDVSNQTASRRIRKLTEEGLLKRSRDGDEDEDEDRQTLTLTTHGIGLLLQEFKQYRELFECISDVEMVGKVTSGLGKGGDFVTLAGYASQFLERLGYEPYQGTLNIRLSSESAPARMLLDALEPIQVDSWSDESGDYGAASCYPATVENEAGERYRGAHIIVPERTDHDQLELEVIAPDYLREKLSLEDGDLISIHATEI